MSWAGAFRALRAVRSPHAPLSLGRSTVRLSEPQCLLLVSLVAALMAVGLDARTAFASEVDVAVHGGQDDLLVDVRAHQLVDSGIQEALLSGLPARIQVRVELWARRALLWDELVVHYQSESRVVYMLLEEHFDVIDEAGEVVFSSADVLEVARWIEELTGLPLCTLDELEPGRAHYVTAEIRLDPLTVEELRDLRRWLSGAFTDTGERSTVERLSGQLLGMVKGKLGLGDRRRTGRSASFDLETLRQRSAAQELLQKRSGESPAPH